MKNNFNDLVLSHFKVDLYYENNARDFQKYMALTKGKVNEYLFTVKKKKMYFFEDLVFMSKSSGQGIFINDEYEGFWKEGKNFGVYINSKKYGMWKESEDGLTELGQYSDDDRNGKWLFYKNKKPYSVVIYEWGTPISQKYL